MKIQKIKIFSNDNEKSNEIKKELMEKLKDYELVDDDFDLGIAVGGDGSFLRMLKSTNFNSNVYYIGINTGTLGFLQEIKPDEIDSFVEKLNKKEYKIEKIGIQETSVQTKKEIKKFYSLNEIALRDKDLNTTMIDIKINDIKLEKFVGDGILISTSVGSTAYNLSFGGAIVYNLIHTLQITPIAPLNSKVYRSLLNSVVVPEDKLITLIPEKDKGNLIITIDGENVDCNDVLKIETIVSKKKINCIRMNDYDFIKVVNEKFLK